MTNREWLHSLSDEELISWLLDDEMPYPENNAIDDNGVPYATCIQPTPKFITIKLGDISSRGRLKKWLKEERRE